MVVHPDKSVGLDFYPASCFFGVGDASNLSEESIAKYERSIFGLVKEVFTD